MDTKAQTVTAAGLTESQNAASKWIESNWHGGLSIAGADSQYVAFWAFCAGVESEAAARLSTALQHIATQAELTARTFPNAPGRGDWISVARIARETLAKARR